MGLKLTPDPIGHLGGQHGLKFVGGGASPSTLLNGLVAYWSLDEASGNRIDATGRGNDLAPVGAPGNVAGKVSTALNLSANKYLHANTNADLQTGDTDFTLAGWVYLNPAANGTLVGKWTVGGKLEFCLWLDTTHDNFSFSLSADGSAQVNQPYKWISELNATTRWYFVTVRYTVATKIVTMQVDNKTIQALSYPAGIKASDAPWCMGAMNDVPNLPLTGYLDEWYFAKRVLTDVEVAQLWNSSAGTTNPFKTVAAFTQTLLVAEGDSMTEGALTSANARDPWPSQLDAAYTYPGLALRNVAIGGTYTAQMISRATANVDSLYSALYPKRILVFWGGTNDLSSGTDSAATIYARIAAYCTERKAIGWSVVVCTLTPSKASYSQADYETRRIALNTLIRDNYATFADRLADIGNDANIGQADSPDNATYYEQPDKLHLKPAGLTVVMGIIKTQVDAL